MLQFMGSQRVGHDRATEQQQMGSYISFVSIILLVSLYWLLVLNTWSRSGKVEIVTDFLFLGSKITADGDCSDEIKRCLLLGRKVMANLDSIFKSKDITFPTKFCLVKAMVYQ